ncbi:MAG: thiamine-phosphate kinase [Acidobacteriota bacterium]
MRLRSLRERALIKAIRSGFSARRGGLILGIGDDAAIIRCRRQPILLTTDLLIENVHFLPRLHPPELLGRKSLNVNLSDIAAMGGRPTYALLGLALRKGLKKAWVEGFFAGLKAAAAEAGVALIGGDISSASKIGIYMTVVGEGRNFVTRSGARPGDLIFVSGYLGDAAAGLRLLRKGVRLEEDPGADRLLKAFLDPCPQMALGLTLSRRRTATAMIDTSDGLSTDLSHLCEESRTGADIYLDELPLSPALCVFEREPVRLALHGGEDYQLLFTVNPKKAIQVDTLRRRFRVRMIGRMTRRKGIHLVDREGKKEPLEIKGFEHLAS